LEWYSGNKGGEGIGVGKEPGLNFLVRNRIGRKENNNILIMVFSLWVVLERWG
jgi:hypothetical protein